MLWEEGTRKIYSMSLDLKSMLAAFLLFQKFDVHNVTCFVPVIALHKGVPTI